MAAALMLTAYAFLGATIGGACLGKATWPKRSPGWGVIGWQALTAAVLLAGLLAALALALCMLPLRGVVADISGLSPSQISRHYEPPPGDWVGIIALIAVALLSAGLLIQIIQRARRARRARAAQRQTLALIGSECSGRGFTEIRASEPAIYCLPGRRPIVVVTSGAADILSAQELELVLRHERRHLRAHHHLAIAFAEALAVVCRPIALFATARDQMKVLMEMHADDAVRAAEERAVLAGALVKLVSVPPASASLSAGGNATLARVRRLMDPQHAALGAKRQLLLVAGSVAGIVIPLLLVMAPALEASAHDGSMAVPPLFTSERPGHGAQHS